MWLANHVFFRSHTYRAIYGNTSMHIARTRLQVRGYEWYTSDSGPTLRSEAVMGWKSWNFINVNSCVRMRVYRGVLCVCSSWGTVSRAEGKGCKEYEFRWNVMRQTEVSEASVVATSAADRRMARETNAHCLPSRKLRRLHIFSSSLLLIFSLFLYSSQSFSFYTLTHVRYSSSSYSYSQVPSPPLPYLIIM
jgi:hypothetical protein